MNIGILTLVGTSNFGASLQAYALQQVILSKGHNCEIIQYDCRKVKSAHDPKRAFKAKGIKLLFSPFLYVTYKKRMDTFRKFNTSYCLFSERCNTSSIKTVSHKYDRIIVGSDQVWNPDITDNDMTYFLDFVDEPAKKCSYAASVGMDYFTGDSKRYEDLIAKFNIISVREQTTAHTLAERINREDITYDVDPTILLCNKWSEFIKPSKEADDYIFLYFTPNNNEFISAVKKFAEKNNCKIVHLTQSMQKYNGIERVSNASPIDFINHIAHAKYVITGSFHALCFSIMLKKEFYVTSSPAKERNGRLVQFLSNLGLEDRLLLSEKYDFNSPECDYDVVLTQIEKQRERSLATINRILSE